MYVTRILSDVDRRLLLLIIPSFSLLVLFSLSSLSLEPFPANFAPLRGLLYNRNLTDTTAATTVPPTDESNQTESRYDGLPPIAAARSIRSESPETVEVLRRRKWKEEVIKSRIAVCLVGGARRFELTGPSIVENILRVYPNSDLFLNSPFDKNSFKLWLLKHAPRIAWVRIFEPQPIPETESMARVLTAANSPNGIQGLLQYFNLVEGCLTMIKSYQTKNNFTYDWIVRTRVDGFWTNPLDPENFVPGSYLVPPGSSYGGLNDRLGIGDFNTSSVALSRLSLISDLDSAAFSHLNSESAFKAQLTTKRVPHVTKPLPFCIVTDRTYEFPPPSFGVPVASFSSRDPLSGAKCRPCRPACVGTCVEEVMGNLNREWSWTEWKNINGTTTVDLCDASGEWEEGWEKVFDEAAGEDLARARRDAVVGGMKMKRCVEEFEEMKTRAVKWEAPKAEDICVLGLRPK